MVSIFLLSCRFHCNSMDSRLYLFDVLYIYICIYIYVYIYTHYMLTCVHIFILLPTGPFPSSNAHRRAKSEVLPAEMRHQLEALLVLVRLRGLRKLPRRRTRVFSFPINTALGKDCRTHPCFSPT